MQPYYQDSLITIYNADCRDVLNALEPADTCFTSPPYADQRDYGGGCASWEDLVPPALMSVRLTEHGQMFVNLGLVHRGGEVLRYWDSLLLTPPFPLFGWYVWDKGEGVPQADQRRLTTSHEWIFHFGAGVRVPEKTVRTIHAGTTAHVKCRTKDGGFYSHSGTAVVQEKKIANSVVSVPPAKSNTERTGHPAQGPEELASFFLTAWPGTVVDPFAGSGTTLYAAKQLGLSAVGVEIHEPYCEIAAKRLAQETLRFGT